MIQIRKLRQISLSLSLKGTPHNTDLSDLEKELLLQCGISEPARQVMTYPTLLLKKYNRVVAAETRSSSKKRNNSCVLYTSGCGLLQKILVLEVSGESKFFLLIKELSPASTELCSDDVTHAQFNKHYLIFHPPRSVENVLMLCSVM